MERSEIPRYVPDASVAVKWFIEEEDSRSARRLRELFQEGTIDLDAPSLLTYEVASALRFHPVARFTPRQLRGVIESLEGLQITREPSDREWASAFTLSLENPISIYDAVYLAFAVQGHSQMVTADRILMTRLKSPETKQRASKLSDFALALDRRRESETRLGHGSSQRLAKSDFSVRSSSRVVRLGEDVVRLGRALLTK